jgi:hypothetical protein
MNLARRAWTLFEPIHALVYFAPEPSAAYKEAGLRGYWMGYFASRSAPMGPVGPDAVTAIFYVFHPDRVGRALPDAWNFSTPTRVLEARISGVDAALRRFWGDDVDADDTAEAAALAARVARQADPSGRPLFASHQALPEPEAPHLALWYACSLLREHRFDGHIAALTVHGLDGCEALVVGAASHGGMAAEVIRDLRGWSEESWTAAQHRLRTRGLLTAQGGLTADGTELRQAIENVTDELAARPWEALSEAEQQRLLHLLRPLAIALSGGRGLPYPNPIGVPRPG